MEKVIVEKTPLPLPTYTEENNTTTVEKMEKENPLKAFVDDYKMYILIGCGAVILVLLLIIISSSSKKRKAAKTAPEGLSDEELLFGISSETSDDDMLFPEESADSPVHDLDTNHDFDDVPAPSENITEQAEPESSDETIEQTQLAEEFALPPMDDVLDEELSMDDEPANLHKPAPEPITMEAPMVTDELSFLEEELVLDDDIMSLEQPDEELSPYDTDHDSFETPLNLGESLASGVEESPSESLDALDDIIGDSQEKRKNLHEETQEQTQEQTQENIAAKGLTELNVKPDETSPPIDDFSIDDILNEASSDEPVSGTEETIVLPAEKKKDDKINQEQTIVLQESDNDDWVITSHEKESPPINELDTAEIEVDFGVMDYGEDEDEINIDGEIINPEDTKRG